MTELKPIYLDLDPADYVHHLAEGLTAEGKWVDIKVLKSRLQWDIDTLHPDLPSLDFINFCRSHNIYYYGRPGDQFHEREGLDLAANNGAKYLMMDNMS